MRLRLNPTGWVYLLAHAVLFLAGFLLARSEDRLYGAVGASLIAAAITGWVIYVYVLLTQDIAAKLAVLADFGLVSAFEARAARIKPQYDSRLLRASSNIDVLGFGLRALREDYHSHFNEWAQKASVRILLLDPEAPGPGHLFSRQRDIEEHNSPGTIETDVRTFIQQTKHLLLAHTLPHPFQVRLYKCLPSVNIFRVDDELFWGPYLVAEQSRNTPTLLVRRGGVLFSRFTDHFDAIWKDPQLSRDIPAGWL